MLYQRNLINLVKDCLKIAKDLYMMEPSLKTFFDNPNTHRLLELVIRTIPLQSHACLYLKRSWKQLINFPGFLSRHSIDLHAHLHSAHLSRAKGWLSKIAHLFYIVEICGGVNRENSWIGLISQFGGEMARHFDWTIIRYQIKEQTFTCTFQRCIEATHQVDSGIERVC